MRDFNLWLKTFKYSISDYNYYIDFKKVINNTESIKVELNILNSLIGSQNIKYEFQNLIEKYPLVLNVIPILLAVREKEIYVLDKNGSFVYNFKNKNLSSKQYVYFMEATGLFDLMQNHVINNLFDYVLGVETGLDSNGRKNRGGHLMEDYIESNIQQCGLKKDLNYFKEVNIDSISSNYGIDLSNISNKGKTIKRFDFVVVVNNHIYAIETNFYSKPGSKLNETARSYKQIALESIHIKNFSFVWFTDGKGWFSAKNNLLETFEVLKNIYNINDVEKGIMKKLFV